MYKWLIACKTCAWVFLGFEHSVNTTHARRSILPALRSVQRGPEDRAVQEDPGKKADTLHQMWMIKNRTFIELPSGPADLELTEKSCIFLNVEPKTIYHFGRQTSLLSLDVRRLVEMYIGCYNKLYYVSNDHNAANKLWDFLSCLNLLIQGPEWTIVRLSPTERWELAGWVKRWWLCNTKPLKSRKIPTII